MKWMVAKVASKTSKAKVPEREANKQELTVYKWLYNLLQENKRKRIWNVSSQDNPEKGIMRKTLQQL